MVSWNGEIPKVIATVSPPSLGAALPAPPGESLDVVPGDPQAASTSATTTPGATAFFDHRFMFESFLHVVSRD
jgi:hypothetical protein